MRTLRWLPLIFVTAFLLVSSTDWFTGERAYAETGGRLLEVVAPGNETLRDAVPYPCRKVAHVFAFGLLALCTFPFKERPSLAARASLYYCAVFALATELTQALTKFRDPAVTDVALNLASALAGIGLLYAPPAFLRARFAPARTAAGLQQANPADAVLAYPQARAELRHALAESGVAVRRPAPPAAAVVSPARPAEPSLR